MNINIMNKQTLNTYEYRYLWENRCDFFQPKYITGKYHLCTRCVPTHGTYIIVLSRSHIIQYIIVLCVCLFKGNWMSKHCFHAGSILFQKTYLQSITWHSWVFCFHASNRIYSVEHGCFQPKPNPLFKA